MLKLLRKYRDIWVIPLITLILTLLSYALLLPSLGYYLDDWPKLYSLVVRGLEGIQKYSIFDSRPYGYWIDVILFKICGTNAVLWHLSSYLFRWLVGLIFWGAFQKMWPSRKREIAWFAILFVVYPLFTQQSISLTFSLHWACYLLFALSIYFMVLAIRAQKNAWVFLVLSILIDIPNLFSTEFFIGVEFIRPLLLWFAFNSDALKPRIKKTVLLWIPFLALSGLYMYWRLFLLNNLRDENSPVLLSQLYHSPGSTLLQLLNYVFKDTFQVILGVWYNTLDSNLFDFTDPFKIAAVLLISALIVLSIFLIFKKNKQLLPMQQEAKDHFSIQAIVLGLAGVLLGCLPGWLINRTVTGTYGLWNDRFGLAAMFGACLVIVGILEFLFKQNRKAMEILMIVMVSLAVGRNFSVTAEYRDSSIQQNKFFSQLMWRAPYIKSRTPIYSDNEYFTKMGVYPTAFAFNLAYPSVELMPRTDYWFYQLHKFSSEEITNLIAGQKIEAVKWYIYFEAESQKGLVINWIRDEDYCVWVLTENDRYNPLISSNTANALALTDLNQIDVAATETSLPVNLFGKEDRDTWCYYYEKGDLARQTGDWSKAVTLYAEAEEKGYSTTTGVELMPFIEAYARTGNAQKSYDLTLQAIQMTDGLTPFLCDNWNRFAPELNQDKAIQKAYTELSNTYSCATYLE